MVGMDIDTVTDISTRDRTCGSAAFSDAEGRPAVTSLTDWDCLVVSRLQDIEDHPDAELEAAA